MQQNVLRCDPLSIACTRLRAVCISSAARRSKARWPVSPIPHFMRVTPVTARDHGIASTRTSPGGWCRTLWRMQMTLPMLWRHWFAAGSCRASLSRPSAPRRSTLPEVPLPAFCMPPVCLIPGERCCRAHTHGARGHEAGTGRSLGIVRFLRDYFFLSRCTCRTMTRNVRMRVRRCGLADQANARAVVLAARANVPPHVERCGNAPLAPGRRL